VILAAAISNKLQRLVDTADIEGEPNRLPMRLPNPLQTRRPRRPYFQLLISGAGLYIFIGTTKNLHFVPLTAKQALARLQSPNCMFSYISVLCILNISIRPPYISQRFTNHCQQLHSQPMKTKRESFATPLWLLVHSTRHKRLAMAGY
jgi:hypothetical protein